MTAKTAPSRESAEALKPLHTLDTEFLLLEDAYSPMCIGSLCVFEGPAPSRDECERFVASRLDAAPAHRKRLCSVPFGLGRPTLIDDAEFDIRYHVRRTALASYSEDALWELMGTLLSTPLDRQRPLWQMYVVDGLPDGRWALITKIHHAIVDGVAGIGVLTAVLGDRPDVAPIEPSHWKPAAPPSRSALMSSAFNALRYDAKTWAMELRSAAQRPGLTRVRGSELATGLYEYVRRFIVRRTSSLQGQVHRQRRYTSVSVQLDDVRRVRDAFGCTVNDVILTLLSGGYRAMLEYRGDDLRRAQLRSLVPVSVRLPEVDGIEGNRISALFCELPVNIEAPRARLEMIVQRLKHARDTHMIEAGAWFMEMIDVAPAPLVRVVSRTIVRGMHWLPQNMLTTVTTNVPGPSHPLYFRGRRLLSWSPYVPITQGARMGSAVLSYNGALVFGITADYDSVRHLEVFVHALQADLASLLAAARAKDATEPALEAAR